jgi:hypothetical protein
MGSRPRVLISTGFKASLDNLDNLDTIKKLVLSSREISISIALDCRDSPGANPIKLATPTPEFWHRGN